MPETMTLPFGSAEIPELPLRDAPLASVLCQVRFPREDVLSSRVAADSIRKYLEKYPVINEERQQTIAIGPDGPMASGSGELLYRLSDKSQKWQVTLAPEFVALETRQYASRHDFCRRLREVVAAVKRIAQPPVFTRLGVRYTNRLTGEKLARLDELVRPELVGVATLPAHGGGLVAHLVSDLMFQFPEERSHVRARWALMPAGASLDPSVEPVPGPSWLLDIDAAVEAPDDFDERTIPTTAEACSKRAHSFFRWAVTDQFLIEHGARSWR